MLLIDRNWPGADEPDVLRLKHPNLLFQDMQR